MSLPTPLPEKILWEGHPSRWNWWVELLVSTLLALMGAALCWTGKPRWAALPALAALVLYAVVGLKRASRRYRITNQRLIEQNGLLSKNSNEMEIVDIRNINLGQTFSQRLMRIGDVEVASAASDAVDLNFSGIPDPEGVKERIRTARHWAAVESDRAKP